MCIEFLCLIYSNFKYLLLFLCAEATFLFVLEPRILVDALLQVFFFSLGIFFFSMSFSAHYLRMHSVFINLAATASYHNSNMSL